mmetsp:Transcript_13850/g.39439  ORF Transcript_13850/g.39439 Transcript_13850/m.39439 type:complete len:458 (+) Transcript_13850:235-1608(+)|eukprot:CAMPEP_0119550512 /NCGR_PEP_ID=MMETSP1352-20130426/4013_1 /TAXON_ID=265584 /ORGANISM="Stauroneis constricta, Strain CCMP1120" /LENGTH=457 /DNA_ID=CAMNT_0007596395 /DNA_START=220 /DNA_END=1593 /DNA_ORIENTATION=+
MPSDASEFDDFVHSLSSIGTASTRSTVNNEDRLTNMMIFMNSEGNGGAAAMATSSSRGDATPAPDQPYYASSSFLAAAMNGTHHRYGSSSGVMDHHHHHNTNNSNNDGTVITNNNRIALFQGIPNAMFVGPSSSSFDQNDGINHNSNTDALSITEVTDMTDQISTLMMNQEDESVVISFQRDEQTSSRKDSSGSDDIDDYGTCEDVSLSSVNEGTGWEEEEEDDDEQQQQHLMLKRDTSSNIMMSNSNDNNNDITASQFSFDSTAGISSFKSANQELDSSSSSTSTHQSRHHHRGISENDNADSNHSNAKSTTTTTSANHNHHDSNSNEQQPDQDQDHHHHVQFMYENAKGAWAWSKQLMVVGGAFNIAETVAQVALGAVGTSLQDIDSNILQPHVVRPLDGVATPVMDGVAHVVLETTKCVVPGFVQHIVQNLCHAMHQKHILDDDNDDGDDNKIK